LDFHHLSRLGREEVKERLSRNPPRENELAVTCFWGGKRINVEVNPARETKGGVLSFDFIGTNNRTET